MLSMHPRHRVSATNPLFYFILFIFDKLKIFFFLPRPFTLRERLAEPLAA